MKCKYSIGHCHVWSGQAKEGEDPYKYVATICPECGRSSGGNDMKEQFQGFYNWARKIYKDPTTENKDYYLGYAQGIRTVLTMLGDDFVIQSLKGKANKQ